MRNLCLILLTLWTNQVSSEIFHNQFAVELEPGSDPDQVAQDHDLVNLGQIGTLSDHFLFEHPRIAKR